MKFVFLRALAMVVLSIFSTAVDARLCEEVFQVQSSPATLTLNAQNVSLRAHSFGTLNPNELPSRLREAYEGLTNSLRFHSATARTLRDPSSRTAVTNSARHLLEVRGIAFEEISDVMNGIPAFRIVGIEGGSPLNKIARSLARTPYEVEVVYAPLFLAEKDLNGGYSSSHQKLFLSHRDVLDGLVGPTLVHEIRHAYIDRIVSHLPGIAPLLVGIWQTTDKDPFKIGSATYKKSFQLDEFHGFIESLTRILRLGSPPRQSEARLQREVRRLQASLTAARARQSSAIDRLTNARAELADLAVPRSERVVRWLADMTLLRGDTVARQRRSLENEIVSLRAEIETQRAVENYSQLSIEETQSLAAGRAEARMRGSMPRDRSQFVRFAEYRETLNELAAEVATGSNQVLQRLSGKSPARWELTRNGIFHIYMNDSALTKVTVQSFSGSGSGRSLINVRTGERNLGFQWTLPEMTGVSDQVRAERVLESVEIYFSLLKQFGTDVQRVMQELNREMTEGVWSTGLWRYGREDNATRASPALQAIYDLRALVQDATYGPGLGRPARERENTRSNE